MVLSLIILLYIGVISAKYLIFSSYLSHNYCQIFFDVSLYSLVRYRADFWQNV